MADPRVPFLETLRKAALASDEDLLRELVEHAVHFLMDLEGCRASCLEARDLLPEMVSSKNRFADATIRAARD